MTTVPDALPPILVGLLGMLVQSYLLVRASRLLARRRVVRACVLSVVFCMILLFIPFTEGGHNRPELTRPCPNLRSVGFVASVGAGVANLAYTFGWSHKLGKLTYNAQAGIWLWLCAGTDLVVTGLLISGMRAHVLGFNASTDHAIKRVMRTAMLTATPTALFGIVGALLATVFPQSQASTANAVFAFDCPLGWSGSGGDSGEGCRAR